VGVLSAGSEANEAERRIQIEITPQGDESKAVDVRMKWTQSILWTNSGESFFSGAGAIFSANDLNL
jgi:hypothetical protein